MKKVRYEEMLPHEFEKALSEFPVAYVPVGSLEWHGRHMALGNDALKVHGILEHTARKFGGIVVPSTYWGNMWNWKPGCHRGLSRDTTDRLFTEIFQGLVETGFKVVIGVTGHDVKEQMESLQKAADAISRKGKSAGFAMMEGSLHPNDPDVGMDHAAKWETSILLYLYPRLVEMKRLKGESGAEMKSGGDLSKSHSGISGDDPRIHASKKTGRTAVEKISNAIGHKARELLADLTSNNPGD